MLFAYLIACLLTAVGAYRQFNYNRDVGHLTCLLDARKDAMKDEQWKIQQEILARRKNKSQMKEYFEKVEAKRKSLAEAAKEKIWAQSKDQVDPLVKWKEAKGNGKINPLGYEPVPSKEDSKLGFNIIIPLNSIGMPQYDNGERFDLRLPYAERGYEDTNSDVMAKIWNGFKSIFGEKESNSLPALPPLKDPKDKGQKR
jgi:hypothetical protein